MVIANKIARELVKYTLLSVLNPNHPAYAEIKALNDRQIQFKGVMPLNKKFVSIETKEKKSVIRLFGLDPKLNSMAGFTVNGNEPLIVDLREAVGRQINNGLTKSKRSPINMRNIKYFEAYSLFLVLYINNNQALQTTGGKGDLNKSFLTYDLSVRVDVYYQNHSSLKREGATHAS